MMSHQGGQGEERTGRRQRPGSDEFEPLNSRQDAPGAGHRGGMAGRICQSLRCCWTAEALFFLLGVLMLVYLYSINIGVRLVSKSEDGLDIKALEPALDAYETELFTLYTTMLSAELLLMEFPISTIAGAMVTPILFGASFNRGSYDDDSSTLNLLHYPAENTAETVFSFRLTEDMRGVDVLREELSLRTSDEGMAKSLAGSAPAEWIGTLPVLDMRQGETVDDLKVLTSADLLLMNGFFVTAVQLPLVAAKRVKLTETRAYPRNAGLTVDYQLNSLDASGAIVTLPVSIRFSISALPAEPMQSRRSDERVGYFNTVYKDLGDHRAVDATRRSTDLLDTQVSLINKRRMGGNSNPLKYYIDPSVPEEWRESMKAGIESWRSAFEAAGLGNQAIKAVLPGDDDWAEDYDAGDIRFNSITWAVDMSEVFAIGPSTIDPRTGEILHSAIVFTDGWIKSWSSSFELYGTPATAVASRRHRSLNESPLAHTHSHGSSNHNHHHEHGHHPHHSHADAGDGHFHDKLGGGGMGTFSKESGEGGAALHKDHPLLVGGRGARKHGASGSLRYHSRDQCQQARLHDVSMSLLPLVAAHHTRSRSLADGDARASAPGRATNEILGAGLKDVIMHEVGHTLGLRHNFQGSTQFSLADLQDGSKTSEEGLTSSVMDYLPINFVSSKLQGADEPVYFTPKVGAYDMWAIKYGYMEVEGEHVLEENEELLEVASDAMPFSTDEDGAQPSGINPLASVYDLGKDPMDYHEDRLELLTELQAVLLDRSTITGEPFTRFGTATESLLRQVLSAGLYSTKFIGGFEISKQRRVEDSTPGPVQLVSAEQQRRALTLILKIVGGEEPGGSASFLPAGNDFSNMATRGGWCNGLEQDCYAVTPVDVLGEISTMRKQVLLELFSASRVGRLRLHAWAGREAGDVLTAPEMFQTTMDAVWGEGGFASERAQLWDNWDLMLFWLDILQAYGSAGALSGIPGDMTATAAGMVYSILDSGANLTASDPVYGLYRATARKVNEWEAHGTDGVLLSLLGAAQA